MPNKVKKSFNREDCGIHDVLTQPTMVSLFSGAGGLDLGLEQAGFCTLLANEFEPYACESLRSNRVLRSLSEQAFDTWFQDHVLSQRCYNGRLTTETAILRRRLFSALGDTKKYLNSSDIVERDVSLLPSDEVLSRIGMKRGQLDLIAGGPPCQPFSRSGKREMLDCDKGQLFMQFVRLVDGIRPRWFVFENVKGIVIHKADVASLRCSRCGTISISDFEARDRLKDATTHLHTCKDCGHSGEDHSVIWDNRRSGSVDIITNEFQRLGYKCISRVLNAANYGAPQIRERLFIIGSRDGESLNWPEPTHGSGTRLLGDKPSLFDKIVPPLAPWRTLNEALYGNGHWRYGPLDEHRAVLWLKNVVRPHDEPVTWTLDRPAPTIGAHQSAKLAIAPLGVPEDQLTRQQWHVLGRRQGDTDPVFVEHEYLSDEELLKLQTFPISWYLHGTRMQRAFQIGNAVPPVLARAVGSAIIQAMNFKENVPQTKKGILEMTTLPAFNTEEYSNARIFLASHVAEMMGRKFEENDWAKVYCAAKKIPLGSWSNLSIDTTHGSLAVEHKMMCRPTNKAITDACGTSIMHPSGTRSIRIPAEEDATKAARIVLQQYADLLDMRTSTVRIVNSYQHDRLTTKEAITALQQIGLSITSAKNALPVKKIAIGSPDDEPDMRTGWLLWQDSLREFLYFEEPTTKPNPQEFVAEWHDRAGGRRKASRNLWVYNEKTKVKVYSITTEAGAKIQPYFAVPLPDDPNLYHFIVQGEECNNGLVRVWLTSVTASLLQDVVGELNPETIANAVAKAKFKSREMEKAPGAFGVLAVEVLVSIQTYEKLKEVFGGVSDEHNFKQLVDVLRAR